MYVYERDSDGTGTEVDTVETPNNSQGVLVRDGELCLQHVQRAPQNESTLVAQDRYTDERGSPPRCRT